MIVERIQTSTPILKSGAKIQTEQRHTFTPDAVSFEGEKKKENQKQELAHEESLPHEKENQSEHRSSQEKKSTGTLDVVA